MFKKQYVFGFLHKKIFAVPHQTYFYPLGDLSAEKIIRATSDQHETKSREHSVQKILGNAEYQILRKI